MPSHQVRALPAYHYTDTTIPLPHCPTIPLPHPTSNPNPNHRVRVNHRHRVNRRHRRHGVNPNPDATPNPNPQPPPNPNQVLEAFRKHIKALGGNIRVNTDVLSIETETYPFTTERKYNVELSREILTTFASPIEGMPKISVTQPGGWVQ
eukprot:scaffold46948_cov84-Phaeocystis_antarctica.AAC.3